MAKKCHVVSEPGLFTHEKIHRRDLAEEHGGWRDADGKWVVGNGGQGAGHDGMRGGSRAAQSRVKSGVQGARWSSGGMLGGVPGEMWSEVQGEMQGEMWSEARGGRRGWGERRSGRQCGAGWGEMGRGKNGVRNHFGRHFTNIVYIIKKMF